MLDFDDDRWKTLKAGYKTPVDLRPLLQALESGQDQHGRAAAGRGSFLARRERRHALRAWMVPVAYARHAKLGGASHPLELLERVVVRIARIVGHDAARTVSQRRKKRARRRLEVARVQ